MTTSSINRNSLKKDALSLIDKTEDLNEVEKYIARENIISARNAVLELLSKKHNITTFSEDSALILPRAVILLAATAHTNIESYSAEQIAGMVKICAGEVYSKNILSTMYNITEPAMAQTTVKGVCNDILCAYERNIIHDIAQNAIASIVDIIFIEIGQSGRTTLQGNAITPIIEMPPTLA